MEIEQFRALTEARFKKCLDLMIGSKNAEYSRNGDKLHNFKQAAILQINCRWATRKEQAQNRRKRRKKKA